MSFQCFWSTQPSYDTHQRVQDFWFSLIRASFHGFVCFEQINILKSDLSYIMERAHWALPDSHTVNFSSFDIIKGVFEIEKALSPVNRILKSQYSSPRWKTIINYSEYGFENLDYGEVS